MAGEWASQTASFTYIILWYDHNSNTELEPKFCVRENDARLHGEPGQKTVGLCLVRVPTPARQSGLGFWPCLEPNQNEPWATNRSARGLPGTFANTNNNMLKLLIATNTGARSHCWVLQWCFIRIIHTAFIEISTTTYVVPFFLILSWDSSSWPFSTSFQMETSPIPMSKVGGECTSLATFLDV